MESGLHEIDHYLDDFLFAGADKTSNCSHLSIKYQLPILNPSKSNSPRYIGNNQNADFTSIFEHCALKPSFLIITTAIADDKTEGPSTWITYLGLLIDTEKMLIQIPDEKVQELLYFLNEAKFSSIHWQ
jgi:hypothetical protein